MSTKKLALLLPILFLSLFSLAQDQILKIDSTIIICRVTEVGMNEIRYHSIDRPELVLKINKKQVHKIILENGTEIKMKEASEDPLNYSSEKTLAAKLNFASPLMGSMSFAVEKSFKPGHSLEAELGVIGIGTYEPSDKPSGVFFKGGYKLYFEHDEYDLKTHNIHAMEGIYIKPEIAFSFFNKDESDLPDADRVSIGGAALLINIGQQFVLRDLFLLDAYAGLGYGFDSEHDDEIESHFGYYQTNDDIGIALTLGVKVGILIK